MKKEILKMLICPACLPEEQDLNPHIKEEKENDIVEGILSCTRCGRGYPIKKRHRFSGSQLTSQNTNFAFEV